MASVPAHMDGGDPVRLALENDLETHFETSIGVTLSCLAPPFLGLTHRPGAGRQRSSVETNVSQGDGGGGGRVVSTRRDIDRPAEPHPRRTLGLRTAHDVVGRKPPAESLPSRRTKCHWVAWCHTCPARRAGGVSHTGGLPLGSRPPGGGTPGGHPVCWLYALG